MKNDILFELLPPDVIVKSVESAFQNLNEGKFGNCYLKDISVSKQIVCGIFHELIVNEITKAPEWRAGKQKVEADLMHESGIHLQVKTSTSTENIAGNRYASKNEYASPSEYYLCINFSPFDSIFRIRAGFVHAESWQPQNGKGNAATMSKEVLSELPLLPGGYLNEMNIVGVSGFGKVVIKRLNKEGVYKVKDFIGVGSEVMAVLNENQTIELIKVFEMLETN